MLRKALIFIILLIMMLPLLTSPPLMAQDGARREMVYGSSIESTIPDPDTVLEWEFRGAEGDIVTLLMQPDEAGLQPSMRLVEASSGVTLVAKAAEQLSESVTIQEFRLPVSGLYVIQCGATQGAGAFTVTLEKEGERLNSRRTPIQGAWSGTMVEEGAEIGLNVAVMQVGKFISGAASIQTAEGQTTFQLDGIAADGKFFFTQKTEPEVLDGCAFYGSLDLSDTGEVMGGEWNSNGCGAGDMLLEFSEDQSMMMDMLPPEMVDAQSVQAGDADTAAADEIDAVAGADEEETDEATGDDEAAADTEADATPEVVVDTSAANLPDPTPISVGDMVERELPPGQLGDEWVFSGEAGEVVSIIMRSGDESLDPFLYLIYEDQVIAANDDFEGRDAGIINQVLPANGDYIVLADRFKQSTGGPYTLEIEPVDPEEAGYLRMAFGQTVTRRLGTFNPVDIYLFEGEQNMSTSIRLTAREGTADFSILNNSGTTLVREQPAGDVLIFTLPYTGPYLVQVQLLTEEDGVVYELSLDVER